jgi:hypothetical protein
MYTFRSTKIFKQMDYSSDRLQKDEEVAENKPEPDHSIDRHVLQPSRVRRSFCFSDDVDRIISSNGYHFLFHFNVLFLLVLDFIKKR